uniref:Uncharacterized protein n=1 Tax=Romanomermis culicivorax TaxID=13658 RepID=A0A915HK20_ROMCU
MESRLLIANTRCPGLMWITSPFRARKPKVPRELPLISSNRLRNRIRKFGYLGKGNHKVKMMVVVNLSQHCLLGEFFSYFFSSTTVVEINESMNERFTIFDSVQI